MANALEGLKILELATAATAPVMDRYMADFGAEVIRIESRTAPDMNRVMHPYKDGKPGINRGGVNTMMNTSKMSLTLNIKTPEGLAIVKKLVGWADVVVDNFTPGTMKKFGLDYDELKKINQKVIAISATLQGQIGPNRSHPGYGFNLIGLAGFCELTGWPDREPVGPEHPYTDFIAPWYGVIAIMGALDYRRRTGKGQFIDISQFESGLSFLRTALLDFTVNGREQSRQGNRSCCEAPHSVYRCKGDERWCAIDVSTGRQWRAFCKVIGMPPWAAEPRFMTLTSRKQNEEELDRLVEAWTLAHTPEEVMTLMQAAGVPAGVVQNCQDLMDRDPQLKYRNFFRTLDHPEMGPHRVFGSPARLSRTPDKLKPAPLMGQHTEYVCTHVLGMPDSEFVELLAKGVFE